VAEVEEHDHEQEHHHDRARVDDHLNRGDELRAQHDVQRGEREQRVDEPERRGDRTASGDEQQRAGDRDDAEEVEVKGVPEAVLDDRHHCPFGSSGSHISQTGWVCAQSRSRS
jgi:hypothetical protein